MEVILFSDIPYVYGTARYAGVYRLATELRDSGIDCIVLDFFTLYTDKEAIKLLKKFITNRTKVIAFSSTFLNPDFEQEKGSSHFINKVHQSCSGREDHDLTKLVKSFIDMAKDINPELVSIIGGANIHNQKMSTHFDYIVKGQADSAFPELVKSILNQKKAKGLIWHGSNYYLDANHSYAFNGFDHSKINWSPLDCIQPNEWLPVEIARGCIFRCSFCNYFQNGKSLGDYLKDESVLRDELIYNYEKFGTTSYLFCDDLYNDSIAKVEKYHKIFSNLPFKISWTSFGRLDLFLRNPEMAELLEESGLKSMFFGIETLHEKAGRKVGKGLGEKKVKDLLLFLKEKWGDRINTYGNFIVGLPGEDKKSLYKTFRWLVNGESGLDSFGFSPLWIEKEGKSDVLAEPLSQISQVPEKFGYETESDDSVCWKNEYLSHDEAYKLAANFNLIGNFHSKIGTSNFGSLRGLGYSDKELFEQKRIEILRDSDLYIERKKNWKNNYIADLLKL